MARFSGKVGYGETQEDPTGSGVYVDVITERQAYGDVKRATRRLEDSGERVNPNITVGNTIEILADQFVRDNFLNIKYVMWLGKPWIVDNVEVQPPRLILSIGNVYNGPMAEV